MVAMVIAGEAAMVCRRYGAGSVAYYGEVYGEENSLDVVYLFMESAFKKTKIQHPKLQAKITLTGYEEQPLKAWAGGTSYAYFSHWGRYDDGVVE